MAQTHTHYRIYSFPFVSFNTHLHRQLLPCWPMKHVGGKGWFPIDQTTYFLLSLSSFSTYILQNTKPHTEHKQIYGKRQKANSLYCKVCKRSYGNAMVGYTYFDFLCVSLSKLYYKIFMCGIDFSVLRTFSV